MNTDRRATALLGRPGELRDRLEAALREAGADIVLVVDPANGDAAQVQAQSPRNVVVLMEPGVEEALDARFDALFDDASIELLFEEASVLASRQGWDLARWGRHLSAKLRGSHDVLPEGHGDDAGFVAPLPRDALKPKAEQAAAPIEPTETMVVEEQHAPVPEASVHMLLDEVPAQPEQAPGLEGHEWAPMHADDKALAASEIDFANDGLDYLEPVKRIPHGGGEHHVEAFDPSMFMDAAHHLPDAEAIPLEPLEPVDGIAHQPADPISLEPASSTVAQPLKLASAASMDAPDMTTAPLHESWSLVDHDDAPAAAHAPVPAGSASRLDGMSMVDDGTIGLEVAESGGTTSTLSITGTRGAVLIVAGVGGPDPLRALLGQLQDDFPRPILIQQHLDAGNYDRLARQMERATRLKVQLATAGMVVKDNTVYVLPTSVGLEEGAGGLAFVDMPQVRGFADVTSRLDPADSALLVLSGAPTDFIEEALRFKVAGAWVATQAEHGCFDHAVPAIVAARGAEIAEPLALAQKLNLRWQAHA
ncbi:MAG: hypothetical protein JSS25_09210 [Proteobacteria bacterium]|nr:hypothetical protein [Pseudomonadota bacterium]